MRCNMKGKVKKQSKNAKTEKKMEICPPKRVKPKKETIMVLAKTSEVIDGTVNGKKILESKMWYGKMYFVLDNIEVA